MTREIAVEMVCPFIQMSESNHMVDISAPKNITCITTDCMAWKVTRDKSTDARLLPHECEGYCKRLGED